MELKVQKWFNWNKLDGSVIHLYDEASGGYRPATAADFAGGGGGGGGDASAANQTTQIGQLNDIIGKLGSGIAVSGISIDSINVNLDQVEALIGVSNRYLSGISGYLQSPIFSAISSIATYSDATNSILLRVESKSDDLERLCSGISGNGALANTMLGSIDGRVENMAQDVSDVLGNTSAVIPSYNNPNSTGIALASGVSTTVFNAYSPRKYFVYQNNSNVDQWIDFGTTASSGNGIKVAAGGSFENPPHWQPRGTITAIAYGSGAFAIAKQA